MVHEKFIRARPDNRDKESKHNCHHFFLQNQREFKNIFLIIRQYVLCKKVSESKVTPERLLLGKTKSEVLQKGPR